VHPLGHAGSHVDIASHGLAGLVTEDPSPPGPNLPAMVAMADRPRAESLDSRLLLLLRLAGQWRFLPARRRRPSGSSRTADARRRSLLPGPPTAATSTANDLSTGATLVDQLAP